MGTQQQASGAQNNSSWHKRIRWPQAQACVFSLTQQEANASSYAVIAILFIFYQETYILIDPCSTHSFVS